MNEVINITPSEPNLSTAGVGDSGTIKLNNLPPLDTDTSSGPKKSVNFGHKTQDMTRKAFLP